MTPAPPTPAMEIPPPVARARAPPTRPAPASSLPHEPPTAAARLLSPAQRPPLPPADSPPLHFQPAATKKRVEPAPPRRSPLLGDHESAAPATASCPPPATVTPARDDCPPPPTSCPVHPAPHAIPPPADPPLLETRERAAPALHRRPHLPDAHENAPAVAAACPTPARATPTRGGRPPSPTSCPTPLPFAGHPSNSLAPFLRRPAPRTAA